MTSSGPPGTSVAPAGAPGKATLHYDRVVSSTLLDALRPAGALHSAVSWRHGDVRLRDVQLRKQPKGPASWVSLYLGLTSVLDIYEQRGLFRLDAHATHRAAAGGFDPSWRSWQTLEELSRQWRRVESYLDRVVHKVHPRWLDSEGRVHALIAGSAPTGFSVVNREASIAFANQPTKDRLCAGWEQTVKQALSLTRRTEPWWTALSDRRTGTSPDFIALDDAGRLLVIEAKPATAAAGITWGPAQVTFYAAMYAAWLTEAGEAAQASLRQQLEQRRALGLVADDGERSLGAPPEVVPVLAIGPGMVSPEAWSRLAAVADAVAGQFPGVAPLEVCRLAADGRPRPVDLAALVSSYPADTQDDVDASDYQDRARAAAVAWKLSSPLLPEHARADGPYGGSGNLYPFCLPRAAARSNLLPEAAGAVRFFADRDIQWHRGVNGGPTTHLLSSQVQCVNALFPLTTDPDRVRAAFGDLLDIAEVLEIDGALLTFEYNGGGHDYLGEGRPGHPLVRGANSTSTDAALAYHTSTGQRELALVEWKYTEQYLGSKLSADPDGKRERRYRAFYEAEDGPLDPSVVPFEAVLVEPLYQLVRQQLLAWRIEQAGAFDRVRVLHIAPATNAEYWRSLDRHEHRRSDETVRDVWQRMLRDSHRDRFRSLDSALFTSPARQLTSSDYRERYGHA